MANKDYLCAMNTKKIAILGSTGSIGTQTLEVIKAHPELFQVEVLTGHKNIQLLIQQATEFKPKVVITTDSTQYDQLKSGLQHLDIDIRAGEDALCEVVQMPSIDIVLAAIVGYAGMRSTISAIKAGKNIALANKETLVVGGEIVMALAKENNVSILPVDSEHSAIFQCLVGEESDKIEKIILTASGGPFLGKKPNFLVNVKKMHALDHPNWSMGAKISIDSATLMNKGLEMIEAKHLFQLENDQIDVIIHPQSIIHSMVQFVDGSIKAQMGLPDMKLPIQYALAYPERIKNDFPRCHMNIKDTLTFEEPDYKTFRNLNLAIESMKQGGNMPAILNASNEVVVDAFLNNTIGFLEMSDIIEEVLNHAELIEHPDLDTLVAQDTWARKTASSLLKKYS